MINGTKRIELRLNDEKRKKIKLNDIIIFSKEPDLKECFKAKVIGLIHYNTFKELIDDFDNSILADTDISKEEILTFLNKIYTQEKQDKYKVLGIRITF